MKKYDGGMVVMGYVILMVCIALGILVGWAIWG